MGSLTNHLLSTGHAVRLAARSNALTGPTSGLAPSYLQANLIVLPQRYAADFRLLCARNPVPCPLLAESSHPGAFDELKSYIRRSGSDAHPLLVAASDIDLRHDAPQYRVYRDGKLLVGERTDIVDEWQDGDHVGFLIGCSYSFEAALAEAGLPCRHVVQDRNVPMYRTNIALCPAGVFTGGTYVVSMRPYQLEDVDKVREITRRFVATHGEPIAWGWEAAASLGIEDIGCPEWGEGPRCLDGKQVYRQGADEGFVPVFWGCGVTPQEAVMRAELKGTVMGHAPGHMIVLDVQEQEVFGGPVDASEGADE
ncbi:hypothetical protein B0H66DRAFT_102255 [Apodospora peruviana]|uniref:Hydro-lyase n=1 Tax=Apodospora peruviana TaxID=516989 RepID=A0AAE0LYQ6_9PEZI|nr:hypothetical protein B0H66DRAFT_539122 [Apodospora peruviana]KAK3311898.1 hypothetical protein B0H66DRAFT_102255 [Apodospora peruviana]